LKKGKFGLYAEYREKQTISLKPLNKVANEIVLDDVIRLIDQKSKAGVMDQDEAAAMFLPQDMEDINDSKSVYGQATNETAKSNVSSSSSIVSSRDERTSDKTLLRQLRPDLSIRKGKYGPYIFHQTAKMSKPAFHPIKPLKDKWESMANLELITAIENTYRLSI
jgi:topoisomerase IA-like protein